MSGCACARVVHSRVSSELGGVAEEATLKFRLSSAASAGRQAGRDAFFVMN
jgi:hypothetical protein